MSDAAGELTRELAREVARELEADAEVAAEEAVEEAVEVAENAEEGDRWRGFVGGPDGCVLPPWHGLPQGVPVVERRLGGTCGRWLN